MSGSETTEFDVIVVGAGPAGEVVAGRLADNDVSVAIVENDLVGGECSFYACMPSKALLRPGELLAEAERVPGAAEAVNGELDVAAALARRDEVIHDLDDSAQLPWLEERSIALFRGQGRLTGERTVAVDGETHLTARKAVILAGGSGAAMPPIEGLADAAAWSNREITTAKEVPASLIILGGGPVGSEMAEAWSRFGSEVTLVEAQERLLPNEEPFAGEQVAEALGERGVDVRVGHKVERVSQTSDGPITTTLDDGSEVSAERLLVAVGRKPHSDDVGLETVGLEPGGYVEVDDAMRVGGRDWLYAIGDINGRVLLTHMGKYQGRVAADRILGDESARTLNDGPGSPRVTFTDPQVAAVGLTLAAAEEAGINAREVDVTTAGTAGASFYGRNTGGTTRIVVDEDRGVLVGATFVGFQTADFLHAATIAIVGEVPLERLWHAVPAFPTRNEIWLNLIESYGL